MSSAAMRTKHTIDSRLDRWLQRSRLREPCVVESGGMWELYSRVALTNSIEKEFRVDIFTRNS